MDTRELLERELLSVLDFSESNLRRVVDHLIDVGYTRAAPRQPEGDHGWLVSLELPEVQCNCAWNPDSHDKTCPVYLRDRMADAQRAIAELQAELARLRAGQEPAAAQVRFRRPEKGLADWSVWQQATIKPNMPAWSIDSAGYEVEYRLLYTTPQPAPAVAALVEALERQAAFWVKRESELGELSPEASDIRECGRAAIAAARQEIKHARDN